MEIEICWNREVHRPGWSLISVCFNVEDGVYVMALKPGTSLPNRRRASDRVAAPSAKCYVCKLCNTLSCGPCSMHLLLLCRLFLHNFS